MLAELLSEKGYTEKAIDVLVENLPKHALYIDAILLLTKLLAESRDRHKHLVEVNNIVRLLEAYAALVQMTFAYLDEVSSEECLIHYGSRESMLYKTTTDINFTMFNG